MQQDGNPFLGSNDVQLSCVVKVAEDDVVVRITYLSRIGGFKYRSIIVFSIQDNLTAITNPGNYLEGRVTLKNLISSENRTVVEYNRITCDDNTAYRCDVQLSNYIIQTSNYHSIEVKGIPTKPDGFPIRTPGSNVCQGVNVNYTCSGMVGAPPGYFRWTKTSNGSTTLYNDTFHSDIPGECNINRTSILSIEVQKEDNNASFRCEVIHELATSEMYQQTIPEMFVYDPYEYTIITKRPDKIYYDLTTPYIELTCFAQGCNLPNYTWYKDIDLNTSIGNESLYVISDVEIESSGSYICVIETIVNGTEEKYNHTVTIDILKGLILYLLILIRQL
ncbi:unnamed protein product [Mytilus edulis]|uniref:Ig-like domain-containing protein n=1 Tax=Mytilus edulis TaxID=6550 RepID=A0A8S3UZL5_MYTED|nr:unnamed protein product [Mytilus edulis]